MRLKREHYLQQIRPFYESDLIKVITGIRRSGKSVLMDFIRDEMTEKGVAGNHIIYISLEDFEYEHIKTVQDLNNEIQGRMIDSEKHYIFIDEIQHVEHFEKVLASIQATTNSSIFVTGSNSKLLSGELSSLLTGRAVEFEVQPFSFIEVKEYLELNHDSFSEDLIYEYIKWGGFPVRFDFSREEDILRYLNTLYHGILEHDIFQRNKRINKTAFDDISYYLLANAGKEFSIENIANYYKSKHASGISEQTIYNYLKLLEKAYLIHPVRVYNTVGKEALKATKKYYATDVGLRTINTNTINYEDTFFLDNIIYNELRYRGFQVYVGKTYKSEIDFVAIKDGKKCFLQVSYLLASEETIRREFEAFRPISDPSPKYVLSLDKVDMSRDGITHYNIVDFLLGRKELWIS